VHALQEIPVVSRRQHVDHVGQQERVIAGRKLVPEQVALVEPDTAAGLVGFRFSLARAITDRRSNNPHSMAGWRSRMGIKNEPVTPPRSRSR